MNPIREAASRLAGHWHKGSSGDGEGNFCGLGHLDNVLYSMTANMPTNQWVQQSHEMYTLLTQVAREQFPDRINGYDKFGGTFPDFNDHPATTEAEVVAVMEKAAVKWDERV